MPRVPLASIFRNHHCSPLLVFLVAVNQSLLLGVVIEATVFPRLKAFINAGTS